MTVVAVDTGGTFSVVLRCTRRYRLPETTRRAHAFVNALRQADRAGTAA